LSVDGKAGKAQSRSVARLHAPRTGPSGDLRPNLLPTDMRDALPFALHCRSNLWTAATTFIFSLVFYSIDVFGRKVKDWRQLCVHFPARVQPSRLQLLAVGGQETSPPQASRRGEPDSGFGIELHRAWVERHDPVVCRIAGERAGGRGTNLGFRIGRR
jgi:hypothetical protein